MNKTRARLWRQAAFLCAVFLGCLPICRATPAAAQPESSIAHTPETLAFHNYARARSRALSPERFNARSLGIDPGARLFSLAQRWGCSASASCRGNSPATARNPIYSGIRYDYIDQTSPDVAAAIYRSVRERHLAWPIVGEGPAVYRPRRDPLGPPSVYSPVTHYVLAFCPLAGGCERKNFIELRTVNGPEHEFESTPNFCLSENNHATWMMPVTALVPLQLAPPGTQIRQYMAKLWVTHTLQGGVCMDTDTNRIVANARSVAALTRDQAAAFTHKAASIIERHGKDPYGPADRVFTGRDLVWAAILDAIFPSRERVDREGEQQRAHTEAMEEKLRNERQERNR